MTWWTATSVTVTNGGSVVSVNTGDDIQIAQEAGGLIIGTNPPVEIKRTYIDGASAKKIELRKPWPYANQSAQPALAFPTDADLAEATRVLREVASDFDAQPNGSTVALRTSNGRLKVTNATESNDAVALGQMGTAYDKNVLGTVSQAAGVPTGAIIQRGSNANGEFVRFADGTQICSQVITVNGLSFSAFGTTGMNGTSVSWTFPIVFSTTNYIILGDGLDTFQIGLGISSSSHTTTSATIVYRTISNSPSIVKFRRMAIGRWF